MIQIKTTQKEEKNFQTLSLLTTTTNVIIENSVNQNENVEIETVSNTNTHENPRIMPTEIKGFEIIGKIEIPKLKIDNYILKESNSKALDVSVTKLYGPEINDTGNFCIAGHNYKKMFKEIIDLEKNDQIILTDVYGNSVTYQVYDIYQTSPKDVSCLEQNTGGEKEVTLITCTAGAIKRVIIKAIEVYD